MMTPIVAKDLTKQAPKSPRERIGGFVIAGRAIDKCRASLDGTLGDYHFDCPLDNVLFSFKGITVEQFKDAVLAAKTYEEVGEWLQANGTARTPAEVRAWSDEMEGASLMKDPEKRAYFIKSCSQLMLNPEMDTTFDWLEADDARASRPTTSSHPLSAATNDTKLKSTNGDEIMKMSAPKSAETPAREPLVYSQTLHRMRPRKTKMPGSQSQKRNNIFSKSRDTREDRGTRQAKTMNTAQTQSHRR